MTLNKWFSPVWDKWFLGDYMIHGNPKHHYVVFDGGNKVVACTRTLNQSQKWVEAQYTEPLNDPDAMQSSVPTAITFRTE